jgi:hypothetical protein
MGHVAVSRPTRRNSLVTLRLIAEVLAGETRITPGGPVDTDTACGLEPFTWDHWLEQVHSVGAERAEIEMTGRRQVPVGTLAD